MIVLVVEDEAGEKTRIFRGSADVTVVLISGKQRLNILPHLCVDDGGMLPII